MARLRHRSMRILTIARALGRQIAREQLKRMRAGNDNDPAKKR
jgi:hypothetical protein